MDNIITFTPAQLIALVLGVCGAIVTISAAIGVITKALEKIKAPETAQNKRLDDLEKKYDVLSEDLKEQKRQRDETITQFMQYFTNDDNRFKSIERSNKVTQNALLALLKHALNGNDIDALKDAEKSLEAYLIEK